MSFLQGYSRKLGVLEYKGTWNASTNTPQLVSSSGQRGAYYIVSEQGATDLDGINDWGVNDWLVFNGSTWEKIDNSEQSYTKNQIDLLTVESKDRSFHTGTQLSDTISNFTESAQIAVSQMFGQNSNIHLEYPDENGKVQAKLLPTGVSPGQYNSVHVDENGRVVNGSYTPPPQKTQFIYKTTTNNSTTLTTFTNVVEMISEPLQPGLYKFVILALCQSTSTTTGVGIRVAPNTAAISTVFGKYSISQSVPGTTQSYEYDQVSENSNVTSISSVSTSFGFVIRGEGVIRISSLGTVCVQVRSEVLDSAVVIKPDSVFILEVI